jgi:hypothetical protein
VQPHNFRFDWQPQSKETNNMSSSTATDLLLQQVMKKLTDLEAKVDGYVNSRRGVQGDKGDKGERGAQGIQGDPGTNGRDGRDGKDAQNVPVPGPQGPAGATPIIELGKVIPGPIAGARLTRKEVTDTYVLDFVLPRGAQGLAGKNGAAGATGPAGKDGADGVAGLPGRNGKDGLNGRDGRPGVQGDRGEKGERGEAGETPSIAHIETMLRKVWRSDIEVAIRHALQNN